MGTNVSDKHVIKCLLATVPFAFVKGISIMAGWTGTTAFLTEVGICVILYFGGLIILRDELIKNLRRKRAE